MDEMSNATKIQELIYQLRVSDACKENIITLDSSTPMEKLRRVLRENRISGVPVVEQDKLVGIISIEDFIEWMYDEHPECTVKERMSTTLSKLYSDEPLITAVQCFENTGYGRFPVLNRKDGSLIGIITKGDIIECVLHELEVDYHEEEIHRYRVSHVFEDVIGNNISLCFSSAVEEKNFEKAGRASSEIKQTLSRLGVPPQIVRRVAIASYEAEMNLVIYAMEGEISAIIDSGLIKIVVKDSGPGIENIGKVMEAGFSTAPDWVRELGFGAGLGLVNMKKSADSMDIISVPGKGTTITLEFNWNQR